MAKSRTYVCPASGRTYPLGTPLWAEPDTGAHLNLSTGTGIGRNDIDRDARGVWRYRAALPVDDGPAITLGEGSTPLVPLPRAGAAISAKLEFLSPTGSFKDRGTTVLLTYLRQRGITSLVEDSSGNAGASVAAYAAAAGMTCRIFVPAAASPAKLVQIRATGAETVLVEGSRDHVTRTAMAQSEGGAFYASHNLQPLFLEGTKTIAYEIWEQLGFKTPDCIVTPVGGGSTLLGCRLGFAELESRGEIPRCPRLYGVQAEACAPLVKAWIAKAETVGPVSANPSAAEGIAIGAPVRGTEMLAALRDTGGGAVAVPEPAIVKSLADLAARGLFVEPTSAVAAAGLDRLLADGIIGPNDRTVLILTGSGLKASLQIAGLLGLSEESGRTC